MYDWMDKQHREEPEQTTRVEGAHQGGCEMVLTHITASFDERSQLYILLFRQLYFHLPTLRQRNHVTNILTQTCFYNMLAL